MRVSRLLASSLEHKLSRVVHDERCLSLLLFHVECHRSRKSIVIVAPQLPLPMFEHQAPLPVGMSARWYDTDVFNNMTFSVTSEPMDITNHKLLFWTVARSDGSSSIVVAPPVLHLFRQLLAS